MISPLLIAAAFLARSPAGAAPTNIDPAAAESLLIRTGLTPAALTAAGCNAEQTDAVVSAMLLFTARPGALEAIQEATVARNAPLPAPGEPAAPESPIDELLDEAFDIATASLANTGQLTLLTTITTNHARFPEIPTRYLVINARTPRQWLALRGGLAAQRFATTRNVPLAQTPAAVLSEADSEPLTIAAAAATEAALGTITQVYRARLDGE